MKILHFTGSPVIGGVASIVYDLTKYFISHGHQVDQLCLCPDISGINFTDKYDRLGVRTFFSKTSGRYSIKNFLQLMEIAQNYDIVHFHMFPQQLYGAVLSFIRKRKKTPIIVTTEHNTWNNRRNHKILKYFDRRMYSYFDSIVCISQPTYKAINNWLDSPELLEKTVTINNGIDINKFHGAENRLSNYIQNASDNRFIVMAARLNHPKDPFTLIKAFRKLPNDVHLIFLGDGNLRDDMISLSHKFGLSDRVHLLGNISNPENIIKGCDIGVLSTHWDGFGLVAAEYMAAGIPGVCSNVEGLKDVVNDPDLLFNPQDSDQLAFILNKLLSEKEYYQNKVSSGWHKVQKYSSVEMAKQYLELYQRLLKNV